MHETKTVYDPRAIQEARDRARWAQTSMARYERRLYGAAERITAAQAKRDQKNAKRAAVAERRGCSAPTIMRGCAKS
jgi:hypothetical protein